MEKIFGDDGRAMKCSQDVVKDGHIIKTVSLTLLPNGRLQMMYRCEVCWQACVKIRRRSYEYADNIETRFSEYFYVEHNTQGNESYSVPHTKHGRIAV